jgi:glyoxylase-like metal-dependent hydrolase (beta-lactamase superfamily II)
MIVRTCGTSRSSAPCPAAQPPRQRSPTCLDPILGAMGWTEIGDRCWVGRYPEWDVNAGVVAGSDGVLVIDTRGTFRQGSDLLGDVRRLDPRPVTVVVNTHLHFDHTFGNKAFADTGSTIHAHENAVAGMLERAEWIKQLCRDNPEGDLDGVLTEQVLRDVVDTPVVPATEMFAVARVIDLGDRRVELLHLGDGHTDGDIVAVVPDTDVVYAGDMIEESAHPAYGNDSFPLAWPDTADRLSGLLGQSTRVVPGHGAVVGKSFVDGQKAELGTVANTIAGLHHNGVPLDDALRHAEDWPYPVEDLGHAIRRGYEHLGPRSLPVV